MNVHSERLREYWEYGEGGKGRETYATHTHITNTHTTHTHTYLYILTRLLTTNTNAHIIKRFYTHTNTLFSAQSDIGFVMAAWTLYAYNLLSLVEVFAYIIQQKYLFKF